LKRFLGYGKMIISLFFPLRLFSPRPRDIQEYPEAESKEKHCVWDPMPASLKKNLMIQSHERNRKPVSAA
jgi:hypothetical protein